MSEGFDENVSRKMPGTRSKRAPRRPWDVKSAAETEVEPAAERQEAEDVRIKPLKSIETKEETKRRVKQILKELTDQTEGKESEPGVIEKPDISPEVMTATDSTMLIEEESSDVLAEIESLEGELESTLVMQGQVEEELSRVREEYDELLNAREELEARVETLKTVEELESNLKAAEEERRLAMERMGELEFHLQESESRVEDLRGELANASAQLEETTREKKKLTEELGQSMEETEGYRREVRSLQEKCEEDRDTIADLRRENGGLNEKLQALTIEKEEADSRIETLDGELTEERQKTKYLETSVENYAVIKATLESDLSAARSALKSIRDRLKQVTVRFKKVDGVKEKTV